MLDYDIKPFVVSNPIKINKFYTMFSSSSKSGARFGGESHDFWECTYIRDGNLCNCVDGKVYNMEKGDLIFYKPMEFHQHYVEDGKNAENFFFSFSFEKCPDDFAQDAVYKLNSKQRKIMEKIIDFSIEAVRNVTFTEEEIARQKAEYVNYYYIKPLLAFCKSTTDMATVTNYFEEMFLDLYNTKNVVEESDSFLAGVFKKAVFYMNDHIADKVTITDIAKHCCISETSLKKLFYQFANIGVHKYFVQLKITQAIILLRNNVSAYEISQQLGFASQAYFSAAFKRETGLTPREYLKKNSN